MAEKSVVNLMCFLVFLMRVDRKCGMVSGTVNSLFVFGSLYAYKVKAPDFRFVCIGCMYQAIQLGWIIEQASGSGPEPQFKMSITISCWKIKLQVDTKRPEGEAK